MKKEEEGGRERRVDEKKERERERGETRGEKLAQVYREQMPDLHAKLSPGVYVTR